MGRKKNKILNSTKLREKYSNLISGFENNAKLNRSKLSSEMARNSSLVFNIGMIKSDAELQMDTAENRIKLIESKVDKSIRKKFKGKKKPSEANIKAMIGTHSMVVEAVDQYLETKWKHSVCWAAVNSITQKGQQLTNIGLMRRKELDAGVVRSKASSADHLIRKKKKRSN